MTILEIMQTFSVYHLDYKTKTHKNELKAIISSHRYLDETVLREYTDSRYHELIIRDNQEEISKQKFMDNKCETVTKMMNEGGYLHIANVRANNLVDVVKLTNSINGYWFMQKRKGVEIIALSERDTRSYDVIITESNDIYLINSVGFFNVNKREIFNVNK